MKKISLACTLLVLGAMVLAACGGGSSNQYQTPGAGTAPAGGLGTGTAAAPAGGTTGTPGAAGTGTAPAGGVTTGTPSAGGATTGTPAGTTAATTPSASTTGTPAAGTGQIPATGAPQFVLLSDLLKMQVKDQSGNAVGSVNGVVVNTQGASSSTGSAGSNSGSMNTTTTPTVAGGSSGSASTTTTPAATSAATGSAVVTGNGPQISFVVVNVSGAASSSMSSATTAATPTGAAGASTTPTAPAGGASSSNGAAAGNQVLVPWQVFSVVGLTGSTGGSMSTTPTTAAGSTSTTPTVAAGTGSSSNGVSAGNAANAYLQLTVDASVVTGAPAFDATAFNGSVDSGIAQYWSNQKLNVPVTGSANANGSAVLVTSPISNLTINDNSGQSLGNVADFVVDVTSGQILYAVLTGGTTLSSSFYVVPISVVNWQAGQGAGTFQATVPASKFQSAPSVSALDQLDFSKTTWNSDIDSFWGAMK